MKLLWDWIQRGYLRLIAPIGDYLVRKRVNPNTITTIGTLCTMTAGVIFATGHISIAGWFLGLTALFDVLDGTVAFARVALVRAEGGGLKLRRTYVFDYTATSIERRQGFVLLMGRRVESVGYAPGDAPPDAARVQGGNNVLELRDWRERSRPGNDGN